jgi:membrane associated rhomboid family serine protease
MDSRFETQETDDITSPQASRLLSSYLQRTCAPRGSLVSEQEQDELREEMSGHILALAGAYQELGSSAEEAMLAALKQFGEAEEIGQAVAREIGKRPSLLASTLTVSMIGGVLVNWVTLSGANYLLVNAEISVIGPEAHIVGIAMGCLTGTVLWKRRKSIRQAALWNTRFYVGSVASSIVALALFSGNLDKCLSLEWLRLAAPVLLQWLAVAGVAGACSGVLTGLWCRFTRQKLLDESGAVPAPN